MILTATPDIVGLISNVGFPIACCIAMFWLNNQMRTEHKKESENFTKVIEANTLALQQLSDKLEVKNAD